MKKCLYCSCELEDSVIVDFCERCGVGVFGPKMFRAIVKNMEKARDNGDLNQGIIGQENPEKIEKKNDFDINPNSSKF